MTISKDVEDIYHDMMAAYGTDTGYLFGIEPRYKPVILIIIQYTLDAVVEE